MDRNNTDLGLAIMNFAKEVTPIFKEIINKDSEKFTKWGDDNLYPNFLLKIYNQSAIHKGICNRKVQWIFDDGLVDKNGNDISTIKVNAIDTLGDFVTKAVTDYVIFNTFASEVVYSFAGTPVNYYHTPLHKIRPNNIKSKFFVAEWFSNAKNLVSFDRFVPFQNEDGLSKLFWSAPYTPSVNEIFAEVSYSGAITSIVTDILIDEFFQNNITNGFSAGHIISTFKGMASDEQLRLATKKLERAISGVDGVKFILDTNNQSDKGMEVKTIESPDYSGKLVEVLKKIERNIVAAHDGSSSLLFGIEKEGSLGNSSELENAYQIIKDNYVKKARIHIVSALNRLFSDNDSIPQIGGFKDKEKLFSEPMADATKEKIYTINELRASVGLPKLADGDKLLGSSAPVQSNFNSDKGELFQLTEDDFEKVADKGENKEDFIILQEYSAQNFTSQKQLELAFDADEDITNYIIEKDIADKPEAEIKAEIKKELGLDITKEDVSKLINRLKEGNIINDKNKTIKQPKNEPERKVEVMYSYEKRPELDGAKIIKTSRAFCKKMCETPKLYSMTDIMTLSSIFGYSIMDYAGGFYRNPDTGKTTPFCRHYFKRVQVIRKPKSN
ncbi:hypothetical protein OQZ33_07115 [Pedobacter sp. MC2016-05]|uniref:hypothetical protein n=1 Tax=Pedobacter sp. MC2016-05 TaxID=2994474 RepID=UPI0022454D20|nr:hypothetical protein [Pedobacter sp. MC2016-05]MCX2474095.1 hypothetical protein [Pedobacter sp. MC2016-05]